VSHHDDNNIEPTINAANNAANGDIDPALKELWDSAPPVDSDRIWQRLDAALDHAPRATRRIAWRPLGRSITAIAAALLATAILVPAVLLTSGGTAQANFLEDVERIDRLADASLSDTTLSNDETERLADRLAELLHDIQDDPDLLNELDPAEIDSALATLTALRLRLAALNQGHDLQTTLASIESATTDTVLVLTVLNNDDDDGHSGSSDVRTETFYAVTGDEQTFTVLDAGAVTLQVVDGRLQLIDIDADTVNGWSARTDDSSDHEIEIDFLRDDTRIRFNAELADDGETIRIRIEDRTDDDDHDDDDSDVSSNDSGSSRDDSDDSDDSDDTDEDLTEPVLTTDTTFSAGIAGNVTLRVGGDIIVLVTVSPADGWTFDSESDGDDLEIEFRRGDERIRFEATLQDDGQEIRIRLSRETDDSSSELDDDALSE